MFSLITSLTGSLIASQVDVPNVKRPSRAQLAAAEAAMAALQAQAPGPLVNWPGGQIPGAQTPARGGGGRAGAGAGGPGGALMSSLELSLICATCLADSCPSGMQLVAEAVPETGPDVAAAHPAAAAAAGGWGGGEGGGQSAAAVGGDWAVWNEVLILQVCGCSLALVIDCGPVDCLRR